MTYSLEKIDTTAACDMLLTLAYNQKEKLERRRRRLGESIADFAKRVNHIGSELVSVQLLLKLFTAAYDILADGKYKLNLNIKIKRLELRKTQLDIKAMRCNVQALLAKQLRYNKLDSQVAAIDRYIAAVQLRKTALYNAPLRVSAAVEENLLENLSSLSKFQSRATPKRVVKMGVRLWSLQNSRIPGNENHQSIKWNIALDR